MIPARELVELRQMTDLWCPAEFARHHDQRRIQQSPFVQIVDQGRDGSIGGREKLVAQVRKRLAMRVPRFVIAEMHLHQ